jgi:hypothetical protein
MTTAIERRVSRIVVGVILLPVAAASAYSLVWAIAEEDTLMFPVMFAMSIYLAVPLAGVQSVLYSLLIEFCAWRITGVTCVGILVSSLLGLVCGGSVFLITGEFLLPLLFAGFASGLVTGLVLCRMQRGFATPAAGSIVPPGANNI